MAGLVGIDVGGTFTDLYYQGDAAPDAIVVKVPTTRTDPSLGVMDALHAAAVDPGGPDAILHGTTIATNTVIERNGARCALVTTAGFRDLLELGRRDRPHAYGLSGVARPLVPRDRRHEVDERVAYDGTEIRALDVAALRRLAAELAESDIEAVVVAFLHSYANPAHERRARDILLDARADWNVVLSSDVLREHYEFERTSTAVVQGYLQPLVTRYADGLAAQLEKWGYQRDVLVMQSNGGAVRLEQMGERAAHLVRSGPAAGVIAATRLAARAGFRNVITGDMGGTSFDVAVVRDASPTTAESTNLDFRLPLRLPMIDVHTIGAGGGSIADVDRGGLLQVGPRSAGSMPGPVCLGLGGTEPTVTDANLVLGRIDPGRPIGVAAGELDVEAARASFARLGEQLGLDAEAVAAAVVDVVDQRMAGRIRLLSVAQGHDPRDFVLVAFGGAGPLHAASLIRAVGISSMLVPPAPGVLCALGCVLADVQYDLSETVNVTTVDLDAAEVEATLATQAADGARQIGPEGTGGDRRPEIDVRHFADMAYLGQIHTLRVPIERGWDGARLAEAFRALYRTEYGNELGDVGVVVETLRTTAVGRRQADPEDPPEPTPRAAPAPASRRPVYFGGWYPTGVYDRDQLQPGMTLAGPVVVEQADATTVIEPDSSVRVDRFGNLVVGVA